MNTGPLPNWSEASGTATAATPDSPIDITSADDNEKEEITDADASGDDNDDNVKDADDSSENSAELNESGWVIGGGSISNSHKARGEYKIPHRELKHTDIPAADLELRQMFSGFSVQKEVIGTEIWPNGRVFGE